MATTNPGWMMLEPFVFRGDDAGSFPDEGGAPQFRAHGFTSRGDAITVSLYIRPPPAISRLHLQCPGGPDPRQGSSCDLVAAHGNLLLLRLTCSPLPPLNKDESPPVYPQEHFICRASSTQLQRIPMCTTPLALRGSKGEVITARRSFPPHTLGILCRGEDFVIAQLRLSRPSPGAHMAADLCVLRSNGRTRECDHKWEIEQQLPIQFKETMESSDLTYWRTDKVLPFKTSLLWVDYCSGGILSSEVFQASRPTVSYLRLPIRNRSPHYEARHFQDTRRCVCVTRDGQEVINFIDVVCEDSKTFGKMILPAVSSVACYALRTTTTTESGGAGSDYYWDMVFSVKSDELPRPLEHLTYPLVSMDKANIAHFLMSEKVLDGINKVSVVTVDISAKEIVSVCPYINGLEDLEGKDAEMIKQKSRILQPFIPSELPKFL